MTKSLMMILSYVFCFVAISVSADLCAEPQNGTSQKIETSQLSNPSKSTNQCEQDLETKQNKNQQQQCLEPNQPTEQGEIIKKISDKEQQESELEEQRLKVLFVDVNSVMENIGSGMDWTANQLDGYFANSEAGKNKAKAWGHIVLGWQPVEGQLFDSESFPVKFKVKARLPNLENKVEIILSDGEDDDFETLPYESVRPEALRLRESSLGAAIQFLTSKGRHIDSSSRIGVSESQVYARSSLTHRSKYLNNLLTFNIQPAIEYYSDDGWGARLLVDTGYRLNEKSEMRYNFSLRERESFDDPKWRNGIFNIYSIAEKAAFITGYSSFGELEQGRDVKVYSRRFSTRYRFNALRSWIYFEIEPFVEFGKDDPDDLDIAPEDFRHSFERNRGITFRFEGHYGFL